MIARLGLVVAGVLVLAVGLWQPGALAQVAPTAVPTGFPTATPTTLPIYASSIVPTSVGQATFGGTYQYTFPYGFQLPASTAPSASVVNGPIRTVYNVVNYGADPNDILNSQPAFQAAATAASAVGGCLYIPAGTYNDTAPTSITAQGPCIFGDGAGATIINTTANANYNVFVGDQTITSAGTNKGIIVRDLEINHGVSSGAATGGADFAFANATNATFENIYTYGSYDVFDLGQLHSNILGQVQIKNVWNYDTQNCWIDAYAGVGNLTINNALAKGSGPTGTSKAFCMGVPYVGAPVPASPAYSALGIGVMHMTDVDFESFDQGIALTVGFDGHLTDSTMTDVFVDTMWVGPALWITVAPNSSGNVTDLKIANSKFISRGDAVLIDGNGTSNKLRDTSFTDDDFNGGQSNALPNCSSSPAGVFTATISGTPALGNSVTGHFTPNGGSATTVTYNVTSADVAAADPITSVTANFAAAINASALVTPGTSNCAVLSPVQTNGGSMLFSTAVLNQSGGPVSYYLSSSGVTVSPTAAATERPADSWRIQGSAQNVQVVNGKAYGATSGAGYHVGQSLSTQIRASSSGNQGANAYGVVIDSTATGYTLEGIDTCYNTSANVQNNTAFGNTGANNDDWISGLKCSDPVGNEGPPSNSFSSGGANIINPYPYDCTVYWTLSGTNVTSVSIINAAGTPTTIPDNGIAIVPRGGGVGFTVNNTSAPIGWKWECN